MIRSRFRIGGLRHRYFDILKNKMGVKNCSILFGAFAVVIAAAIVVPMSLSSSEEDSFAANVSDREKVVDIRFLNTQTKQALEDIGKKTSIGASNLIKTKDNIYVLIDTGTKNDVNYNTIYQALKDYQGSTKVTLDYLVVSHMHADHYGNVVDIINSGNIKVKNVIVKAGRSSMASFDNIIRAARSEKANIYTNAETREIDGVQVQKSANYKKMNTEGTGNAAISVGKYLKLYFYNTTNVYSGKTCVSGYHPSWLIAKTTDENKPKTSNNKYVGLDNTGLSYPNITYTTFSKLVASGTGFDKYYYVSWGSKDGEPELINSCNDNSNAYGILAEIKTDNGNKYAYFSNDIDNGGYDILPTKTDVVYYSTQKGKSVTKKGHNVYGIGRGVLYEKPDVSLVIAGKSISKNVSYSESKAALEVADKLGSNLSNLVIYQPSHHGINNAPDALATLNVNRPEVYAVFNRSGSIANSTKFDYQRTNYNLRNTKKLFSGYSKGEGVYCAIDNTGDYKCSYNKVIVDKLSYDMNSGSGTIAAQTCLEGGACSIKVSSTKPTRIGYKFLGWAKTKSAKTAAYSGGSSVEVSGNVTLYAVWAPDRTLTYDLAGGNGTIAAQTCNPTSTTGNCNVVVSSTRPTREGYRFLGWAATNDATTASYTDGNTISLSSNKTIYAVWQRVIKINTSVDGGNGTITPSMTDVVQGSTRTIVFSPRSGYEIDNVRVNDVVTEVANNKLILTAEDRDLNVIVKYKLIPVVDPDPPILSTVFHMYFSGLSGETGTPNTLSCTVVDASSETPTCDVTIPDAAPIREGYSFLGYSSYSDRTTVAYRPGETYTLSDDVYVISAWGLIYTLNYNLSDGVGEIASQTCSPTIPNGGCDIVISNDRPIKENYEFFGWATDSESSVPEYLPGDTIAVSGRANSKTLYAIWVGGNTEWIQGQDYVKTSGVDLVVEFEYPMQNFASLAIDDSTVDSSNYTVTPGSTVVTISSEYADTLEVGGHTMQANYNNGVVAQTTFAIEEINEDEEETDSEDDDLDDNEIIEDEVGDGVDEEDGEIMTPNTGEYTGGDGNNSVILGVGLVVLTAIIIGGRKTIRKIKIHKRFGL